MFTFLECNPTKTEMGLYFQPQLYLMFPTEGKRKGQDVLRRVIWLMHQFLHVNVVCDRRFNLIVKWKKTGTLCCFYVNNVKSNTENEQRPKLQQRAVRYGRNMNTAC